MAGSAAGGHRWLEAIIGRGLLRGAIEKLRNCDLFTPFPDIDDEHLQWLVQTQNASHARAGSPRIGKYVALHLDHCTFWNSNGPVLIADAFESQDRLLEPKNSSIHGMRLVVADVEIFS